MQQTPGYGRRLSFGSSDARLEEAVGDASNLALTRNSHELRFQPLMASSHALAFPCDSSGEVCIDELSECARVNYFFARATVGRDYGRPEVRAIRNGGCSGGASAEQFLTGQM